jgi:arsenate-mycothiol transferase
MQPRSSVLFICVHNAGKSQTAEAILRHLVGDQIDIYSGGTDPDENLAADSVAALAEIGIGVIGQHPKAIDDAIILNADRVVILGNQAKVEPIAGMKTSIETWPIVEPSEKGIQGPERAALIRDDIFERVQKLRSELIN